MSMSNDSNTTNEISPIAAKMQKMLQAYVGVSEYRTVNGLARGKDISTSTLHDINNGENKKYKAETVFNFLRAINPSLKSASAILDSVRDDTLFYPLIKEYVENVHPTNSGSIFVGSDYEQAISDREIFQIIMLAERERGIERKHIADIFGKVALDKIDNLVSQGVLAKSGGVIYGESKPINTSRRTALTIIKNVLIKSFDWNIGYKPLDASDNPTTIRYFYHRCNSKLMIPYIHEVIQEAVKKIKDAFNDPKYQGDEIVFFSALATNIIKSKFYPEQDLKGNKDYMQ